MASYLGIDLTGASRAWDWTLLGDDGAAPFTARGDAHELREFVRNTAPRVIAVDAPSKRNCGLMRQTSVRQEVLGGRAAERSSTGRSGIYEDCRVCEAELGLRGIKSYFTSGERGLPDWIGTGLRLFEELASLGYSLWDAPGTVQTPIVGDRIAIEVYPHASFVVRLGWIPQIKTSLAGCLERIACLRGWSEELGVSLGPGYDDILAKFGGLSWAQILADGAPRSVSHDKLDALAAAFTAKAFAAAPGVAFAVGRKADGVIVLPDTPRAAYQPK